LQKYALHDGALERIRWTAHAAAAWREELNQNCAGLGVGLTESTDQTGSQQQQTKIIERKNAMKNRPLFFWVFSMLLFSASMLVGGCTSSGSTKGAYPTLKQTRMNVDWPMTRYRNAVSAGAVTPEMQQQVNTAYQNYQQAFDAAVKAANGNYDVTTPDNVKALANQLLQTLGAIPF
jgi:hypothetical protein